MSEPEQPPNGRVPDGLDAASIAHVSEVELRYCFTLAAIDYLARLAARASHRSSRRTLFYADVGRKR